MSTRTFGGRTRRDQAIRNVATPLPADVAAEFIDSARQSGTTGAAILRDAALAWLAENRAATTKEQEGLPLDQ